ncbi:AlpA family phage regulatory protein [Vitreoscilla massiliensis]|uniref:AlpA family phage regulatory protein n=1 Tax=Vitreoscilla massiliensis TaxID=1689272 RepID=A0ABY4E1D6_9NEIS|nr:AlpA family phage regulatory protein [Vitreoscilla massiliensis]UOO89566.1 AlpA family phage regulatory protein [Vitreoscilla massiliensis]
MSTETNQDYDLIDIKEVKATIDISTATIYRMMQKGTFPRQRKIGKRSLWRSDEIKKFKQSLEENQDANC